MCRAPRGARRSPGCRAPTGAETASRPGRPRRCVDGEHRRTSDARCRTARRRRGPRARRRARASPAISDISVDLPHPDRPKSAVTPGVGAQKAASSAKSPRRFLSSTRSISGPACGASARLRNSETSSPARPSDSEMRARRAASASPSGVCSAVYSASGRVRVSPGMLAANVMTAPNSPRPAANAVTAPARMPGAISGSVMETNRSNGPAPSVRAASSSPRSTFSSEMRMARTTSGKDMTAVASAAPVLVNASWMPKFSCSQPPMGPRTPNSTSSR